MTKHSLFNQLYSLYINIHNAQYELPSELLNKNAELLHEFGTYVNNIPRDDIPTNNTKLLTVLKKLQKLNFKRTPPSEPEDVYSSDIDDMLATAIDIVLNYKLK